MTPAVLHFASRFDASPGGIWWEGSNEHIQTYYTDPDLGRLGAVALARLRPDVDIPAWFDYLDNRMPYGPVWVAVTIPDGMTPQEVLAMHQRIGEKTVAAEG